MARAAVNALRALLERHDHIVHEVDGQNDFGEDLHVEFTADGKRTGDLVKVQIKGGRSWRRKDGYSVPVGHHGESWADGNVPVLCIVHDPDTESLYWANATEQLLSARRQRRVLKNIMIDEARVLDDRTVAAFVLATRHYLSRYRGNQALRARIGEMAGVDFEASDIVLHFVNEHGEDLVFWQRQGEGYATLLHSDLDWRPEFIGPETLHFDTSFGMPGVDARCWMRTFPNASTVGSSTNPLRWRGPLMPCARVSASTRPSWTNSKNWKQMPRCWRRPSPRPATPGTTCP
ncbi:DUF4365 domain-containing protein [Actinomadura chokoriensis]|uniref:DUF4365 domain-containing protein n=1 Tax=Actinomadura chokoriensis TaxID=454156 RepID=UPI0031F9387C